MKQFLLILLFVYALPCITLSQDKRGSIKGIVTDNNTHQPLEYANILLQRGQDSSQVTTTITNKSGHFTLGPLPDGTYRLTITYLGYQPLIRTATITALQPAVILDTLLLQRTGFNLRAIEIKERRSPITLKKDTMEYNADAFKTRENAVLEELLRKLPGLIVEKDGTIRAQGETIGKILVEGKPFFGSDPRMATANLSADMIDKIQLIDRQPDPLESAGQPPGSREKVINITLKDDKKGKYFGRAGAGYGSDGHFGANVNLNKFSEKQQLYVILNGNNINNISLLESGVPNGMPGGGISRNWNGFINYNKALGPKLQLSTNYIANTSHTENGRNSTRKNFLADSTYTYDQQSQSLENQFTHSLEVRLDYKIDSTQKLSFGTVLKQVNGNSLLDNTYTSLGGKAQLLNRGNSLNTNDTKVPNYSAAVFYEKRFKKTGRAFNAVIGAAYDANERTGINKAINLFMLPNNTLQGDTLDQRNNIQLENRSLSLSIIYTEPIFKDRFIDLSYAFNHNYTNSEKLTYDYNNIKGSYDRLNDSLSNNFNTSFTTQIGSVGLRTQKKKYNYSLALNIQANRLQNSNLSSHDHLQRDGVNLFPSFTVNYQFSNNRQLRFSYFGGIQLLTIAQLQPVPDNSNPLYISLGNPDLKTPYNHILNFSYNTVHPRTGRTFGVNIFSSFIHNKIVSASWLDSLGRQVTQPVNMSGAYNINAGIEKSFPLPGLSTFISAPTTLTFSRDVSLMNGVKGYTRNFAITQSLNFNYAYEELFDISTAAKMYYNNTSYTLQQNSNYQYYNYSFSFNGAVHLPLGLMTGGSIDYIRNTGQAAGYNQDAKIINAFISKSLLRNKQALVKLQGFDLLGQNVSVSRNIGENYIEDVQSNVLTRFFMLSFTYFLK